MSADSDFEELTMSFSYGDDFDDEYDEEFDDDFDDYEEDDEDSAFFAKMVLDESGEEAYVEPTDEEFEAVLTAYEALMDEEDSET